MPVYNKRGILLLPKVIVLNPKDGIFYKSRVYARKSLRSAFFCANISHMSTNVHDRRT